MDAPITLQSVMTVLGVIVAIVAGLTALGMIIKWINGAHDKMEQWDGYTAKLDDLEKKIQDNKTDTDAKLQQIRAEQCEISSAMLAVLEGLMQLKCNGPVTEAHTKLTNYLNDQAHQ